ncbi:MAG TPA: (Fe-S)-binding protein [Polyangiaceae bacterium]|jgi:Fe-S oxidoreductase
MSPYAMLALLVIAWSAFGWSAARRWKLMRGGAPSPRFDRIGERLLGTYRWAFKQERMDYYQPAGIAHKLIFLGFVVLLLRTLMLWGRGFSPTFSLWVLAPWQPLGRVYEFAKDSVATLVVGGTLVFFYYRLVKPLKRTTKSFEALLILGIIATMMIADMAYDGAAHVLLMRKIEMCGMGKASLATASQCDAIRTIVAPLGEHIDGSAAAKIEWSPFPAPAATLFAVMFRSLGPAALVWLARIGFWTHSTLVLLFLNLLPHSKHFHVITGIPNVFFRNLNPPGRLVPLADSPEKIEELMTKASELDDPTAAPIGISRAEHLSWKAILDFYTCTECGRCSENCPAHRTGKILSPKHLTLDLRNNLYEREEEFLDGKDAKHPAINLAPDVIHPDVLWACTTCRACEEQCPVFISYVDKIVDMRRNLMMVRNEFPNELNKVFEAMMTNGNPWNVSRMDREQWSDGLGVPLMKDKPDAQVLYWVGCMAATDPRAKKIARSVANLLKQAKVDFAILGTEETCTGDPARRAGHELLFAMLAQENATTLNGYKEKGGMKTVVTACPHCFNTLKNEYPDFGCKLEVVHHTDFLLGLLAEKKLTPTNEVAGRVTYHDSCYLGRYNGVYESPREILKRIPGVELVEPNYWTKQRGLCCGAGGGQMFMEEQNKNRVNVKRTLQLVDTNANTIASACPFCMTMLTDGLKSQSLEDEIKQMDVAEMLDLACAEKKIEEAPLPPPVEAPAEPAVAQS